MNLCALIEKKYKLNYVYLLKDFKNCVKIMFRPTCSIISHILKIDEKFDSLHGTIQTSFSKLSHNNYNNIQILSKKSYKLGWQHIFVHKACHKKVDRFSKVRSYIVYNLMHLSHSFL
jgi:hypothetical protein